MHRVIRAVATALAASLLIACSIDDGEPSGPIPTPDAGTSRTNLQLGETCNVASQCASAQCFAGGQTSYCTLKCGPDTAKTICAPPAFNGVCNKQGFCRKP